MADQHCRRIRYQQLPLLPLLAAAAVLLAAAAGDARKTYSSSFTPNFDPDYPQFTPFAAADFVSAAHVRDEPALPKRQHVGAAAAYDAYGDDASGADADGGFEASASMPSEDLRPFKTFVLDMYKNYRNQYLTAGNQTIGGMLGVSSAQLAQVIDEHQTDVPMLAAAAEAPRPMTKATRRRTKPKRKQQQQAAVSMPHPNTLHFEDDEIKYNVGPGVNISVDAKHELVNVFLDEDCLKDVFTGK